MKIGNLEVYGIIYKIINKINGKVYIGQTTQGFNNRYNAFGVGVERVYNYHKDRRTRGQGYNSMLYNAMNKYGVVNFEVSEVLDIAFSKSELNIKEMFWIERFKSWDRNYGYNRTKGGDSNIPNEECKKLISLNHHDISGDNHPRKKIDSDIAKEIKINIIEGMTLLDIANKYNIPVTLVENIKLLRSWKNVCPELNERLIEIKGKIHRNKNRNLEILYRKLVLKQTNSEITFSMKNIRKSLIDSAMKSYKNNKFKMEEILCYQFKEK